MFGAIFRVFFVLFSMAVLAVLFVYAFVAALIVTPFLLIFFFFLNRHLTKRWREALQEQQLYRGADGSTGPIIDHDPNDLPR